MIHHIRPAIVLFLLLAMVTGLAYPLAITGIAQAAFSNEANGSRVARDGQLVGSDLIGQGFSQPDYFWPRPSATGPQPYNAASSSGSNIGPTGRALLERTGASVQSLGIASVPADAVTASGSGLDPHITPQNADTQIARVAAARGLEHSRVAGLVSDVTELPVFGIFGEPRINVLRLNLALDDLAPTGN